MALGTGKAVAVSKDHRASAAKERAREKVGGAVKDGLLALNGAPPVARAFGDAAHKAAGKRLIATPEVTSFATPEEASPSANATELNFSSVQFS